MCSWTKDNLASRILQVVTPIESNHDHHNEWLKPETSTVTRGHTRKLIKPRCNSTLRLHCFSHRVVNPWNSLPENVVSAPSVNAFKSRLDNHWKAYQFTAVLACLFIKHESETYRSTYRPNRPPSRNKSLSLSLSPGSVAWVIEAAKILPDASNCACVTKEEVFF